MEAVQATLNEKRARSKIWFKGIPNMSADRSINLVPALVMATAKPTAEPKIKSSVYFKTIEVITEKISVS